MKYFEITGFWKDTNENFTKIVASGDYDENTIPDYIDEQVFYYGLDKEQLKDCAAFGWNTDLEFVVLTFQEIKL